VEEAYDRIQAIEIHLANHIQTTKDRLDSGAVSISRLQVKVEDIEQLHPGLLAERVTRIEEDIRPKKVTLPLLLGILGSLMAIGNIVFMFGQYPDRQEHERAEARTYERIEAVKGNVHAVEKEQAKQTVLNETMTKAMGELRGFVNEALRAMQPRTGKNR
jgi:hypothetical protein